MVLARHAMAMPPEQEERQQQQADDDFTFPTPPQQLRHHHLPPCSPPPVWLQHLSSSPIRRSFSAADCAASPWRGRASPVTRCRGGCSPALSDYTTFCDGCEEEEEEEERMDSLWEDLNDDEDGLLSLDVSRRRSVGGTATGKERERAATVLGASKSSRRRPAGLVAVMRALKKMLVAHKGKSRVHRDEQHSTASASPSPAWKK